MLQLINRPSTASGKANGTSHGGGDSEENHDEWGEFLHLPGQKFYDFDKIREEIVKDTELKTGKNLGKCQGIG